MKCRETFTVITNNCYKQTVMRQGAELRNRQTGTGNKQINELTADPSQNGWFINYKKTGFGGAADRAGNAFFTDFDVLANKLDDYIQ